MEARKKIEKNHYNKQAEEIIKKNYIGFNWKQYGAERFGPILGAPFRFIEERLRRIIEKKREVINFLDYGCGTGVHSIFPAKIGAKVYGIDISEKSLEIAKKWAEQEGVKEQVKFLVMDCERLEFPENFFDIVFNCGTLSCLNRERAFSEIVKVLKPDGYFISIDTLGHNPILNLKRKINLLRGLRTKQTYENVLRMKDIEIAKQYFNQTEVYFFNLFTLLLIPFQKFPGFKYFLNLFQSIDKFLFQFPFFQKYAFKVVFIFSRPKK